jgi:hypothetical protein
MGVSSRETSRKSTLLGALSGRIGGAVEYGDHLPEGIDAGLVLDS